MSDLFDDKALPELDGQVITDSEVARVLDAHKFLHKTCCPGATQVTNSCATCPPSGGVLRALRVLHADPRDAKGARWALHDSVCMSGCDRDSDHADRTQTKTAAALRKFCALSNPPGERP